MNRHVYNEQETVVTQNRVYRRRAIRFWYIAG